MRIISEFHDFYDGAQSSFDKDDLKFIRKPKKVEDIPVNFRDIGYNQSSYDWRNVKIGFCGKLYTGYQFHGPDLDTKYLYSLEEIEQLYKKMDWKFEKKTGIWNNNIYKDFLKVEEQNKTNFYKPYFEKYLTPIFVCTSFRINKNNRTPTGKYEHIDICEINGGLRDFNFQTVFSVQSAFQEIQMYLGNMAFPEKNIPKITDEVMLEVKGFDKYSFRKDPTK